MKKRKTRRKAARRVRRSVRRRSSFKTRCKCKGKRRPGRYAKFVAKMWNKNRAYYMHLKRTKGIGAPTKLIVKAAIAAGIVKK